MVHRHESFGPKPGDTHQVQIKERLLISVITVEDYMKHLNDSGTRCRGIAQGGRVLPSGVLLKEGDMVQILI
jgi:hypothetical protein